MTTALTDASANAVGSAMDDPFGAGTEGMGGTTFVKFTGATGLYTAGQDDDVIEHGTRFVADLFNAKWVWSFWWDSDVMESFDDLLRENPLSFDNPPDELPEDPEGVIDMSLEEIYQAQKDDPANFRDGWSVQASFNMRPMDGSDEEYTLKLNKGVAMNAFHILRKNYGRQRKLKAGLMPVIEIQVNEYKPKAKNAGKKRYAPVLKIVDWISEEDLMALQGDDPSMYDDEPETTQASQIEDKSKDADVNDDQAEDKTEDQASETKAEDTAAPARGRRGRRGANVG